MGTNENGRIEVTDFIHKTLDDEEMEKIAGDKYFDICLMNPPFDLNSNGDQLYVKFINKVVDISDKAVIITPSNGFLSKSKMKNKELKKKINEYKPELILGNWEEFDVHPTSKSCISIWDKKNPNDKIKIGNKEFDNQDEIILNDNPYLDEFYNKLNEYINEHESIYDKCVANPKNNQYMDPNGRNKVQEKWNDKNTWFAVFPYCIASHFTTFDYLKYSDELWNGPARILVPFNEKEYAKNCYLTIQKENSNKGKLNDFFELISESLVKSLYIKSAEKYKYFPYLDFSKSYTDEELFKMIGMKYDKDEINKILNEK